MSEVRVKDGESLESALRRFKRSTARSGVLAEVRKREAYEKPSVRRKEEVRGRSQAQVQVNCGAGTKAKKRACVWAGRRTRNSFCGGRPRV